MKRALVLASLLTTSSTLSETVSLQAVNGKFTATVVLNNELQVLALLDLGATTVVVCDRMARELGLHRGDEVTLGTVGDRLAAHRTSLSSIRIGAIEVRDVGAVILADAVCDEVLLGTSYLSRLEGVTLRGAKLILTGWRAKSRAH